MNNNYALFPDILILTDDPKVAEYYPKELAKICSTPWNILALDATSKTITNVLESMIDSTAELATSKISVLILNLQTQKERLNWVHWVNRIPLLCGMPMILLIPSDTQEDLETFQSLGADMCLKQEESPQFLSKLSSILDKYLTRKNSSANSI